MKKILILYILGIMFTIYGNTKNYKKGQKSFDKKKYVEAEKYYLIAVNEEGSVLAMRGLGYVYRAEKKYDLSKKYFKMAIENGDSISMSALGSLYVLEKKYGEAEEYLKMAKEEKIEIAKEISDNLSNNSAKLLEILNSIETDIYEISKIIRCFGFSVIYHYWC